MNQRPAKTSDQEWGQARARLLQILTRHVGSHRACDMGSLYEQVFGEKWNHKINDSRKIREMITELRKEGTPICSSSSRTRGGYYLAATDGELNVYLAKIHSKAVKALALEAQLRRVTLAELLGQTRLNLTGSATNPEPAEAADAAF